MRTSPRLREIAALLLTAFAGSAVAVVYGAMTFPALREQTALMDHNEAKLTEMPVIMENCCVFFSTIYFVGGFLSRHLINHGAAERFHAGGRSHVRLVHGMSGAFVVLRETLLRPGGQPLSWQVLASLLVGMVLVALACFQKKMPGWQTMFASSPEAR